MRKSELFMMLFIVTAMSIGVLSIAIFNEITKDTISNMKYELLLKQEDQ